VGPLATVATKPDDSKADEAARDISRTSTELWALYEVTQTLSASLGLMETAELVIKKIEEIYSDATCAFLLWDPSAQGLIVESVVGLNREYFVGARTQGPESRSAQVVANRKTYFGPYDREDLTLATGRLTPWTPLATALIVPVCHEAMPLGAIAIYHPDASALSGHDRQLIELVGERSAAALYNGLLFDRTRGNTSRDHLTGVYNLRHLLGMLDRMCDSSRQTRTAPGAFSILCLDLDNFKPINDGFGHAKGDSVLKDLAGIFCDVVGGDGTVSRYGGDEFVIVVPGADLNVAEEIGARIQAEVDGYDPDLPHPIGKLRIGVSVGAACYPEDGTDAASLLAAADHRMYACKTERKLQLLAASSDRAPTPDRALTPVLLPLLSNLTIISPQLPNPTPALTGQP
jgi:diguanylate cyclase (GGDEF)-like protein